MKKVLVISYYWPPAGGPGVQRWLNFIKYLPSFGIQPIVYVPSNAHYPLQDPSLVAEVPEHIRVIRKKILEPYGLARIFSKHHTSRISSGIIPEAQTQNLVQKILLFIRGNLFIPDARKFWIKPSANYLTALLQRESIDTIITTGPPHSMHLIGMKLKEATGVRWIADFRDPWTRISYHDKLKLLPGSRRKHESLEEKVLSTADLLLTTSFSTAAEFRQKTQRPVEVITNGYDGPLARNTFSPKHYSLAHIGSLLSGRNPENLWAALGELGEEVSGFRRDLRLELTGAIGDSVINSIRSSGLEANLEIRNYVSHEEALRLQRKAALLLLIEINREETRGIIPGKLFEYMASGRPILGIGPEGADFRTILEETHTGTFFAYHEKEAIKSFLLKKYQEFQEGILQSHPVGLEKYSRKSLTGRLSEVILKYE